MKTKRLAITLAGLVAACGALLAMPSGVDVTIENVGSTSLHSVTVAVTGKSYVLGDIPPGGARTVNVDPVGESDVELHLSSGRRLKIDTYIEPGYEGNLKARIDVDHVVSVEDHIRCCDIF